MTETSVSTPDTASDLPLIVLIGRVLWQIKWFLLLVSAMSIALAELGYESAGGTAVIYGLLFALSFDVARNPELTIPRDWTLRPAILLPSSLLMLVVGFITGGFLGALGASWFTAISSVNVMLAVAFAALGPWLVRLMASERTAVRIGFLGRLWRFGLIAGLGVVWLVLSLLVIAYGIPDAPDAIAIPVGILLRVVADSAIVAHATVLVAAVGPKGICGNTEKAE